MGSHVDDRTIIARFVLKIIYPHFSFDGFLIYLILQYFVERDFKKKYKEQSFRGYKFQVIPEELHHEIVNTSCHNTAFYGSQHQVIVPEDLFRNLYSTNIFYRDGKSLWVSLKVPDVGRMFSDMFKTQDDLKNLKNCMINSASNLSVIKKSSPFKIANSLNMDNVSQERIVQIVPHSESSSASPDYVFLTEKHLFNIKNNLGTKYLSVDDFRLKFATIKSRNLAPTIASQIVVQMVNSSQYLGTDLVDELLSNYFQTPKFLHLNDYFGIRVTEEFTGHLHMKYFSVLKHLHKIFFKCVQLKPSQVEYPVKSVNVGYFVIRGETELRQEQNFNSFIPQRRFLSISANKGKGFHKTRSLGRFIQSCPFGLTKYLEEILLSIEPFVLSRKVHSIHNDLKCVVQLVFLLRGDLGSGTQILTSRVAEYLGIHYCVETCRRLMSTTAKQTEAKIDGLFQKAKNLSPVLVHLTDFDVFGLDAEKNEDTRIVDSFVKKLRDLYENFNKFPIIFIASCDSSIELKSNLNRIFLEEFKILSPNKQERTEILSWLSLTKKISFCNENFEQFLPKSESMENEHNLLEHGNKNVSSAENKELNIMQVEEVNHLVENNKTDEISVENIKTKNVYQNKNQKNKSKAIGKKSKTNKTNLKPIEETNIDISSTRETKSTSKRGYTNLPIIYAKNPGQIVSTSKKTENMQKNDALKCLLHEKALTILEKISSKTDSFVYGDLETLTNLSLINGYSAQQNMIIAETDSKNANENRILMGSVREKDFDEALESLRLIQSKKLGALRIPNVQWEDIGGLEDLKKEIFRTIELPLKFPHLLANSGLKRSGLLLWGPPGCGKTLVARAISSQLRAAFLSVKGPELLDMYVGQSERNMRDMFAMARASAPCVIFLDEAEAAAGARGASGDAGGAADRLVSQLLAELDGVSARQIDAQTGPVIVVAATNRPDLVEPALLRPGRLDKLLYVGPYQGKANKVRVLKASCRGFNISNCVSLVDIADQLPDKCTGADLSSVVNKARRGALARTIQSAESGAIDASTLSEKDIIILNEDFQKAIVSFVPSISKQELDHYESLRSKLS